MDRANMKVLISIGQFLGQYYPAMVASEPLPALERIVVMSDEVDAADARQMPWDELISLGETVDPAALDARISDLGPADLSDLMFTSGTTGRPKGAMFTHAQTILSAVETVETNRLTHEHRSATFGPFSHNASYKAGWVAALVSGGCTVITTDMTPAGVIALIARNRVTHMPAPPTIWQGVLDAPEIDQADLSSLQHVGTGGTTVPVMLIRRILDRFPGIFVMTGYGLTECCGTVTHTRQGDTPDVIALSAGRPVPGTRLKIVGPSGDILPVKEPGEILVKRDSLLVGYLDDPEATAAAFDAEGWLKTGDIGWLDTDGNLHITDRLKDMFIVGGFNCYPAEVEHRLSEIPGVAQSAVIGVPDERLGQVGFAFVVRRPGAEVTEAEIIAYCRTNIANYKVPRAVRFVDALPMTASGKVMKAQLRDLVEA
jgi:acyl-CoA synthetase (AMP-forming)/AMP-acid ligase II